MRVENGGKQREDNFGLRNREPARRVGVRRTIADCGFKSKETGVRDQRAVPSWQQAEGNQKSAAFANRRRRGLWRVKKLPPSL
jgi:hypothetical protein